MRESQARVCLFLLVEPPPLPVIFLDIIGGLCTWEHILLKDMWVANRVYTDG